MTCGKGGSAFQYNAEYDFGLGRVCECLTLGEAKALPADAQCMHYVRIFQHQGHTLNSPYALEV